MTEPIQQILDLLPYLFPILIGVFGGGFVIFKAKIRQLAVFFVEMDKALEDNQVSDAEYKRLWNLGRQLFNKL